MAMAARWVALNVPENVSATSMMLPAAMGAVPAETHEYVPGLTVQVAAVLLKALGGAPAEELATRTVKVSAKACGLSKKTTEIPIAQAVGTSAPTKNAVSTSKGVELLPTFMNCGDAVVLAKPNE
jgi:glycerol dehydrogenase-like iron-containing ADH family enzyme